MIKIGIIGHGYWGCNLVRNFINMDGVRVCSVADINADQLESVRKCYPTVKVTTDIMEILRNPTIDAVVIATPVTTHFELVMAALTSGKHVWVEKPTKPVPGHSSAI